MRVGERAGGRAGGRASGRASEGAINHYYSLISANGRDSKNVMDII